MAIKTTEREVAGWISEQINRILESRNYPFEISTIETSLTGTTGRFPDIVLWHNRSAGDAFCFMELKQPGKTEDINRLKEVADRLDVKYALTWDFLIARLYYIDVDITEKKPYPTYVFSNIEEWLARDKKNQLVKHLKDFIDDLIQIKTEGHLHKFKPDKYFFINILHNKTKILGKYFAEHLTDASKNKSFRKEIEIFISKQGLPDLNTKEINELIASQWVYGLITKILFYYTIRRHYGDLPDLYKEFQESRDLRKSLLKAFEAARRYDWHAVFESENSYEKIGIPDNCGFLIAELLKELEQYNFSQVKEDIIGEIFESLIPEDEKRHLGQYFTREDLVDFIIGFVVDSKDGFYCDPTCGSGTFLNRIYSRLKWLSAYKKKHRDILPQIWGIDIAKFPAELATSSLFRQDISDYSNFPRIQAMDFFDIKPGQIFEFPPPKVDPKNMFKVKEPIPEFDGMIGNFPFIRQEQIEKKVKGYKSKLTRVLTEDWYSEYRDIFKNHNNGNKELRISGQADIFTYLYFHATKFVKQGSRLGFITSNSYLDVGYGYELKKFFLKKFKVIAIVASWVEPWFHFASVNTVFTILERCDDKKERLENVVRFVKLKKKLEELIPYPDLELDESNRWLHIDKLVSKIENSIPPEEGICSIENHDFRIRYVKQDYLSNELEEKGKFSKWGMYIRAPEVYFEILYNIKESLTSIKSIAKISRGFTTGINKFFYLTTTNKKAKSENYINVKNEIGWNGDIEKRFLKSVIKSPKNTNIIKIKKKDIKKLVFYCDYSKSDLKVNGFNKALKYIEWGENQQTEEGVLWPKCPTVVNRKPGWWSLSKSEAVHLLWTKTYDNKFLQRYSHLKVIADQRLYQIITKKNVDVKLLAAIINSSIFSLIIELNGRVNLGDGALDTTVEEVQKHFLIINPSIISSKNKDNIIRKFSDIINRDILPIKEESKKKDRQALDNAILEAVGLDPKIFLPRIYKGLIELVDERLALPKMRKKLAKIKVETSIDEVKKQVEQDVLPDGLRIFPDSFLLPGIKMKEIPVTGIKMKIANQFFGKFEIVDEEESKIYDANNIDEANYIICAQRPNTYLIKMPKNTKAISNAIISYEIYINELYEKLIKRALSATHEHNIADRIALEILIENGYTGNFNLD